MGKSWQQQLMRLNSRNQLSLEANFFAWNELGLFCGGLAVEEFLFDARWRHGNSPCPISNVLLLLLSLSGVCSQQSKGSWSSLRNWLPSTSKESDVESSSGQTLSSPVIGLACPQWLFSLPGSKGAVACGQQQDSQKSMQTVFSL